MFGKQLIVLALVAVCMASAASEVEFVELNDVNQGILNMDISQSLKEVQTALQNNFAYGSTKDAQRFVQMCKILTDLIGKASDSDYNGLAAKIKAILAQPDVQKACQVQLSQLDEFSLLDSADIKESLGAKRLQSLVALRERLNQSEGAKILLSHLFEHVKSTISALLLATAAQDTDLFFGERKNGGFLSVDVEYKTGCEIGQLNSICKLVRRSQIDNVPAIGADFADFKALLVSGNEAKLNQHVEASGVSLDQLKAVCKAISGNMFVIRRVDQFKEAEFLSQSQIDEQARSDKSFDFYYQLEQLCESPEIVV